MVAGVIVLLGLLAVWIGITGRGNTMWQALTGGTHPSQGGSHLM